MIKGLADQKNNLNIEKKVLLKLTLICNEKNN